MSEIKNGTLFDKAVGLLLLILVGLGTWTLVQVNDLSTAQNRFSEKLASQERRIDAITVLLAEQGRTGHASETSLAAIAGSGIEQRVVTLSKKVDDMNLMLVRLHSMFESFKAKP